MGWHAIGNSPSVADHAVLIRYLEVHYGLELFGVGDQTLGLSIIHPILEPGEAVELATWLLGYAETVGAGDTLGDIASHLREGGILTPWWD